MPKQFLLDTGLLLSNPAALYSFEENNVYITEETISELSEKRRAHGPQSTHAQEVLRMIAGYTENNHTLPGGGQLQIVKQSRYVAQNVAGGSGIIKALKALSAVNQNTILSPTTTQPISGRKRRDSLRNRFSVSRSRRNNIRAGGIHTQPPTSSPVSTTTGAYRLMQ